MGAIEITKNLQTIERSLKAIKEAEFRINKLWGKTSKEAEFRIDKLWGKTSSGKLDNSLYIIESMKIREEIKKALAAVDAIKAEEFKFLNENILPHLTQAEVRLETENISSNDQEMQMLQNLVKAMAEYAASHSEEQQAAEK